MTADMRAGGFRLREFRPDEDIPHLVALINLEYPDEPTTIAQEEHWEQTYPAHNPRLRFAVEDVDGRFVGTGACLKPFWMEAPGVYSAYAIVDPRCRRRGIATALLARFEAFARDQGAEKIWPDCRESQTHSIAFLRHAGFTQFGIRFESALDLAQFDPARFAQSQARAAEQGYVLTTLAEVWATRSDPGYELFELYRDAMADVPLPGGARIVPKYEEWRHFMLEGPTFDPTLIFLAMQRDRMVGLTSIDRPERGPAITSASGILPEHRGRGLAMALKVMSLRELKARGCAEARAHNDTANPPILHLNQKLGYQRLPGWLQWEKRL